MSEWRDLGQAPLWVHPEWLPPASGAFLTWTSYDTPPDRPRLNEVDLIVNADVLFALGRFNRLDVPGVAEAIGLINSTALAGYADCTGAGMSIYSTSNYAYHFCVSRAYRDGRVLGLKPAVERIAEDLESSALRDPDGAAYWDGGDPQLDTAFAILTLLNAGRDGSLVDSAVGYLLRSQDPVCGNWQEAVFMSGAGTTGVKMEWWSRALTTAVATEALCRDMLGAAEPQLPHP